METLLLPGMDGTGKLFASFERRLGRELRPRRISFPVDRPLRFAELLDQIEVPPEPFAVVAESFSGPLGIRLANEYRERVRALVLVATFVRYPSRSVQWMSALLGSRLFAMRPPKLALRWALLGMDASEEQVEELRSALAAVDPQVLASRVREITSIDVTQELAAVSAPLLYIAGRRDRLVGASVLAHLEQLRPDIEIHVLDAPHLVLQRKPVEAGRLISEFLLKKLG